MLNTQQIAQLVSRVLLVVAANVLVYFTAPSLILITLTLAAVDFFNIAHQLYQLSQINKRLAELKLATVTILAPLLI